MTDEASPGRRAAGVAAASAGRLGRAGSRALTTALGGRERRRRQPRVWIASQSGALWFYGGSSLQQVATVPLLDPRWKVEMEAEAMLVRAS